MSLLTTNRIAVLCDVNTATTDTDESNILIIGTTVEYFSSPNVLFTRAPNEDSNYTTDVSGCIGEFWRALCGFRIKEKCILKSFNANFIVRVLDGDGNETDFNLESWNNPCESFYNGLFTDVNIVNSNGFFLADNSAFNIQSVTRHDELDGGGYYGYLMSLGFQLGFQWWQVLNDFAKQFETYRNQYWAVYSQNKVVDGDPIQVDGGSASIKFVITWNILNTVTGITTEFNHTCDVVCNDEEYTSDITGVITTEDAIYGDNINKNVADDAQTKVTGTFSGTNIGVTSGSIIGEMAVYYSNGSINRYDRIMTGVDLLEGSLWVDQPEVTVVNANTITVSGILNIEKSLLQRLYCRFDYAGSLSIMTDDGDEITTDGGDVIIID